MIKTSRSNKTDMLFSAIKEEIKQKGILNVIGTLVKIMLTFAYYKSIRARKTFTFQGKTYRYFYHLYNTTWENERSIEIPIVMEYVKKHHWARVLEVGNVLSFYYPIKHDIIDKYEKAEGIINVDVIDYCPSKKYELVVAISTLEHIGTGQYGEDEESRGILDAIENLKNCLAEGGKIIMTVPLGENPVLDKILKEKEIPFTHQYGFKRIGANKWIESEWKEIEGTKYHYPFIRANAIVVGVIET
ncbi:MAG: DUF268 domain-containing protein [Candidatus Hodarchaeota archaeon]